ncbi:MAG: insulinase family protein, partial [Verrucomicrobiota bacterium]|nr:insulinase family protein [Verrucomicrobiota bacterium]
MTKFRLTLPLLVCLAGADSVLAIAGLDVPPPPSPPHAITFTQPKEVTLENGLRVIVAERPGLPLVSAYVVIRHGAEVDPENLAGVANLTGSLLTKGTEKMSAPQIANAIESLGGSISSAAAWDSSSAAVTVMSDQVDRALSILADVVLHPSFQQEEIDRLKLQRLDGIRVALQQPASLAAYVTSRVVFGSTEYGHPSGGTIETLQAITREQIVKLYRSYYTPANATLIFSGNITLEEGKAFAQRFFGEWKGDPATAATAKRQLADWKPANVVIDMPQAGQASVTVAKPAIKRDSPDYYAGLVANAALGNGFVSRLNREIRIKRGLSYGARSSLETRRDVGPFAASA